MNTIIHSEKLLLGAFTDCADIITDSAVLKPDVILMDINLPGTSGIQGLKKLRKKNEDTKVLVLSTSGDNQSIAEAITYGANGFILKKTSPAKLLEYSARFYIPIFFKAFSFCAKFS